MSQEQSGPKTNVATERKQSEKSYRKWTQRLESAKKKLKLNEKISKWKKNRQYLTGSIQSEMAGKAVSLCNEVSLAARDTGYAIYPDNPYPAIRTYREEDDEMVELLERLLHQEMSKAKLPETMRAVIQDNRICGIGFLKVAYEAKWDETKPDKAIEMIERTDSSTITQNLEKIQMENQALLMGQIPPIALDDFHQLHIAGHSKAQEGMDAADPRYHIIQKHKQQHIIQAKPLVDVRISIKRVAPHNFLYDPDATCWEDRQWEAERTIQSIADLKANPLLENVDGAVSTLTSRSDRMEDTGLATEAKVEGEKLDLQDAEGEPKEDEMYVEVWNIHDIKNDKLIILANPHKENKVLYESAFPYNPKIPIYVRLVFNEINDKIEGIPDLDYVIPLQEELNEVWKKRRKHVKVFGINKLLRERGAWDSTAIAQFRDPNQFEVQVPPGALQKTMPWQPASHPSDAYAYEKQLRQDIQRYMGVQEIMTDIPKSETATQAQILGNWFNSKLEHKRTQVAKAVSEVGKAILLLHKEFTDSKIMIKKQGLEGAYWDALDPKGIPEDFDVEITNRSWQDANPEVKKRQWTEVMQLLLQMPEVDRNKVIIHTLQLHGISNPEKYLKPPQMAQPPMQPGMPPPARGQTPQGMAQNASMGQQVGQAVSPQLNQ